MAWFQEMAKQLKDAFKSDDKPNFNIELETAQQYKERWRSIYIIYFTMFLISLGFSIIVTGVWPYLDKLDPTAGKEFMGFIVAANPFAQMLFSPIVGWWSNRLGSIRIPLITSMIVFAIASSTYSSLELFSSHRKHWMLWSRFLVGVSSANIAACRSYLSAATTYSERTKAVSMISLAQVLGFVVGPAIQAAVVPLGGEGVWLIENRLRLNMYTASGWINVLLSLFNAYLFFPSIFKEHKIAAKEAMMKSGKDNVQDTWKEEKIKYGPAWSMIVTFFICVFDFMILETLSTSITMDQFAWSKGQSLWYMGILMSVGAILAIATFASIGPLSKRFSEIKIMIWGGFLFMAIGSLSFIPYGTDPPVMYDANLKLNLTFYCEKIATNSSSINTFNVTILNENLHKYNRQLDPDERNLTMVRSATLGCGEDLTGCPSSQEWCSYTPQLTLKQFLTGYVLTTLGYPIAVTIIQTIFSKMLGSKPQGVWMGLITGSGCLSRVLGPVFVTYIYEEYGVVWTFGFTSTMIILCLVWLLSFQKYLTPTEIGPEPEMKELKNVSEFAPSTAPKGDDEEDDNNYADGNASLVKSSEMVTIPLVDNIDLRV